MAGGVELMHEASEIAVDKTGARRRRAEHIDRRRMERLSCFEFGDSLSLRACGDGVFLGARDCRGADRAGGVLLAGELQRMGMFERGAGQGFARRASEVRKGIFQREARVIADRQNPLPALETVGKMPRPFAGRMGAELQSSPVREFCELSISGLRGAGEHFSKHVENGCW
jgi:hypothetical protein